MSHTYNLADMQDWVRLWRTAERTYTRSGSPMLSAWLRRRFLCYLLRDYGGYTGAGGR